MSASGIWQDFSLREAIAVLSPRGLVSSVMLPSTDGLVAHGPDVAAPLITAVFCGARLDSRQLESGELFVALPGERTHGRRFCAPWLGRGGWVLTDVVKGPDPLQGLSCPETAGVLLCPNPVRALAVLAGVWRQEMPARVVAVTGTNGKTTTKDFLAALLSGAGPTHATAGNFNNALGLPLTLLQLRPAHRFAVIEMGASAMGEIDHLAQLAQPDVGVITNAAPAHLAEFGSLENIIAGKGELLDHLPADGTAVLNTDSPGWADWQARARCRVVSFGAGSGDHQWSHSVSGSGSTLRMDDREWPLPLPGVHNAANLAAAVLGARAVGVSDEEMQRGLAAFAGSAHRGVVLEVSGRKVLDDSYNANPVSMVAAARTLMSLAARATAGRRFAVLGAMAELGAESADIHRRTGSELAAVGIDQLVAVGQAARPLEDGFDAAGGAGHYCATVSEAAEWLASATRAGDLILVKGSRSAAMEEILPLLAAEFGGDRESQD